MTAISKLTCEATTKREVNVAKFSENSLHVPYIKEPVKLAGRKLQIPTHMHMHQLRGTIAVKVHI